MVSRQAREAERRRQEKARARFERAAKVRRERSIVAAALVAGLVIATGAAAFLLTNDSADGDGSGDTALDGATPTTDAPTPLSEPLPTTDPELYDAPPAASEATAATVTLETSAGDVVVELDDAAAPQAVASFERLVGDGFYDGTACHRLLPDSLLQCGDPTASGMGGPGYSFGPIENAPTDGVYPAGTLAMARPPGDGEGMGSQFFLVFADVPLPDDAAGGYTVFGTVVQGLDVLQSVGAAGNDTGATNGRPATDVIIEKAVIS
ncbi:peptidylprolyl isomerase [Litorihabitans aurantiacus]|uniref:Peptidyl-prolyl cis-trans isomerase n=1 Tax=Litorihabitans aurantiacus TaxID=1930061 RepID=A0AA37XDW5_9MICO|nr:peptidylprolyl isomerase [Litorihabitans aurantiacus]GMA31371.1 peptidyl-prolyl cis-trans isomerase [Litorihabitans aurantiacus]